jgi:hypothetical protein
VRVGALAPARGPTTALLSAREGSTVWLERSADTGTACANDCFRFAAALAAQHLEMRVAGRATGTLYPWAQ